MKTRGMNYSAKWADAYISDFSKNMDLTEKEN